MTNYKEGDEKLPFRHVVRSLPAMVYIYNLNDSDDAVASKEIDMSNPDDRKYLGRITAWALQNHHSVETVAMVDVKVDKK